MRRFVLLGRFLIAQSSGVAALRRGLPLYLAIGIFATIIFAPSGLDASTVVRGANKSMNHRGVLLLAWLALTAPVARVVLAAPRHAFLRALPLPRWQILGWLAALLAVVDLPWFALWARGAGVMSGLAAIMTSLALHAGIVAGLRRAGPIFVSALVYFVWVGNAELARPPNVVSPLSCALLTISVAGAGAIFSLPRAWDRALEHASPRSWWRIAGPPATALAAAYSRVLLRRHGAALVRAALVVLVAVAWTCVALHNDASLAEQSRRVLLAVWIPTCVLAVASPAGPLLRAEMDAEWVLAVCGTTPRHRRMAHAGLLAVAGCIVGLGAVALVGATLAWDSRARFLAALTVALSGGILAACTAFAMRWAVRGLGRDGARVVGSLLALIAIAEGILFLATRSA